MCDKLVKTAVDELLVHILNNMQGVSCGSKLVVGVGSKDKVEL